MVKRLIAFSIGSLAIAVFLTSPAYSGGLALSGIGSKAIGMGGAFRGLADNWSAAYWNPAGLAQLEQSEVSMMMVGITPRTSYKPDYTLDGHDIGFRNGATRYPVDKTFLIPDGSGFLKFNTPANLTFGVGFFVPYGMGSDWDIYDIPPGYNNTVPYPKIDHSTVIKVIDIHPSIALSLLDGRFMLGAGLAAQYGEITYQRLLLSSTASMGLPRPLDFFPTDFKLEGDGWGLGGNFGMLFKLTDNLQFGASYRTPVTLKIEGEADMTLYLPDNPAIYQDLLDEGTAEDSISALYFLGGTWHSRPKGKADFKLPGDIGFGIAYKPSDRLTLTADVNYTQWEVFDSILVEFDGVSPSGEMLEDRSIVTMWESGTRYSFGFEYLVTDLVTLRGGYYFDPSPIPDETFTPIIPDIADKNSFNLGAALNLGQAELAYNFEYIAFKDREIAGLEDPNGDGAYDNFPGLYKMHLVANHVSLIYRFEL